MKFEILTLFPEIFGGFLNASMMKRGTDAGLIQFRLRNIRDYTTDKHHVTDDTPYGGGPGMVMKPEPVAAAIEAAEQENPEARLLRIYLTPQGEVWNQKLAEELSATDGLILICGRYEGIDERVMQLLPGREISMGDFVMTGGEVAAMAVADSVARLVPGVLGNADSAACDSFSGEGLLDCPHYTRPETWRGQRVPDVLLSGHHAEIDKWRRQQSLKRTAQRRPDLMEKLQ